MNKARIHFGYVALLAIASAAGSGESSNLVGILKNQRAITGCAWIAWIPSASSPTIPASGYIFLADRNDSRAVMNISGRDVTLTVDGASGPLPKVDEVLERVYHAPDIVVRAEYTTTGDCSGSNSESCEVSRYSVRFEVTEGERTEVVVAVGEVGC